jgi:hypothetical protein
MIYHLRFMICDGSHAVSHSTTLSDVSPSACKESRAVAVAIVQFVSSRGGVERLSATGRLGELFVGRAQKKNRAEERRERKSEITPALL